MSSVNVQIARRGIEAFNRHDLDGALADAHPEVEWHVYLSPEGEVARGHDGVKRMWRDRMEIFERFQLHADEVIDAGNDVVLVVGELRGRAPGDDAQEISAPIVQVYWIEDGLLRRVRGFRTMDEALEAVRETASRTEAS